MNPTQTILTATLFIVYATQALSATVPLNTALLVDGDTIGTRGNTRADTRSTQTTDPDKTLIGKSIRSQEVLLYRTAQGDTIVATGGDDSHTKATYRTFRGDTVLVEHRDTDGKRNIRIAFPGENGKEVSLVRPDSIRRARIGDFEGHATYKTWRGDTIQMEEIKTGEKRQVRIIFPGADGKNVAIATEMTVLRAGKNKDKQAETSAAGTVVRTKTHPRGRQQESSAHRSRSKTIFGPTFSRIDLGWTRPINGGHFKMDGENEFLAYRGGKTMNFGFDVFQVGRRMTPAFRMFLSVGFDWTYFRLKEGLQFDPQRAPYEFSSDLPENFSKNRLTSTYLRIPLTFELKGPRKNSARLAFGPITGILLKGTQRYRLDDGKTSIKHRGHHGFAPFQYGVFARLGSKHLGIYGKYYLNDTFENSPAGAGLKNFTFGLTAAF